MNKINRRGQVFITGHRASNDRGDLHVARRDQSLAVALISLADRRTCWCFIGALIVAGCCPRETHWITPQIVP